MSKISYKSLFIVIVFILIPVVFFLRIYNKSSQVLADWYNDAWSYRQAINISAHSVGETNVYITATVNIGTTTKAHPDDGDFRFTDATGNLLDYYISSGVGTTNITFHINFDLYPAGAQTIYAYYGNPIASNGFSSSDFATAATGSTVGSYSAEELGGGPVAYWKFDEGVGTTAYDSTSSQKNLIFATGTSAPTWITSDQCISEKCLSFSGINYLSLGSTLSSIKTISFWIKSSTTAPAIFDFNGTQTITVSSNIVSANNFSTPSIYINGKIGTTISANSWNQITISTGTSFSATSLKIGKVSTSFISGYLDTIKIFAYSLSATQAKQEFNLGAVNLGSSSLKSFSDGLVGYWKFDENVGTTTVDSSGNNNLGTFGTGSSAPSWSAGKYGVGTSFNGTTNYVQVADNPNLKPNGDITIASWVKLATLPSTKGYSGYILFKTGAAHEAYSVYIGSGVNKPVFRWDNDSGSQYYAGSGSTLGTGIWYHLVAVKNNESVRVYLNGILDGDIGYPTGNLYTPSNGSLYIGSNGVSNFIDGSLDEVRIYNRALNPTEVKALYNYAPGPVGWWKMDENMGTKAYDSSGNGNTSTAFTGNTIWKTGKFGSALFFDGTDDVVRVVESTPIDLGSITDSYTVSAWIKYTTCAVTCDILDKMSNSSSAHPFHLFVDSGNTIYFRIRDLSGNMPSTSFVTAKNDGAWHHIVGVRNVTTDTLSLYVDGVLSGSTNDTTTASAVNNDDISIGNGGGSYINNDFNGFIDDIKIYNYARTPEQIIQDMQGFAKLSGPIGYWKFDENYGSIANNTGFGGSTFNGTLATGTSSPTWSLGKVNKSLTFATNDYLSVGGTIDGTQSVSFWVNPSGITNNNFLSLKSGIAIGATGNTIFAIGFSSPTFYVNGIGTSSLTNSVWQHVVVVAGAGTTIISNAINIGRNSTNYFNGILDEVKIYNHALTLEEVKIDYNRGNSITFGNSSQTIGATTTSIDYCIPGDTTYCASPVGEWKFEEGVGTTAYDSSGNGNHGLFSGAEWRVGKIGKGVGFTGTGNINMGSNSILNFGSGQNFTLAAWVKPNSTATWPTIVSKGADLDTIAGYRFEKDNADKITFYIGDGISRFGVNTKVSVADGKWHYVEGVVDATGVIGTANTMYIYLDGVFKSSTSFTAGFNYSNPLYQFDIAKGQYSGSVDDVKVYNYARTPAQIAYDYNKGGPIGWWKFDECQGSIVNDSSGIGNSGTISIGVDGSQSSLGTCTVGTGTSSAWTNGAIGKINSSLYFDGTDDVVNIGGTLSVYSLSFWVKPDIILNNMILQLNSTVNVGATNSTIVVNGFSSPIIYVNGIGSTALTNNVWQHITISSGSTVTANAIKIGQATTYFSGKLDDIKIFNYPLTATQIKNIYNGGSVNFR